MREKSITIKSISRQLQTIYKVLTKLANSGVNVRVIAELASHKSI